jgi:L-threonylcarbamoyladenylate synthase
MSIYSEEIKNALVALSQKQTILYPTDTVWGIGCDATNENAVSKIFKIKNRENSKSLVVLVDGIEMLHEYIEEAPKNIKSILSTFTKPTTVIYNKPKKLAVNIIASNNTVAIRIVQNKFCQSLIENFGKPIVSTSANLSGEITPRSYSEISKPILDSIDYVVKLEKNKVSLESSSIIRILKDNSIEIIRD